MPRPNTSGPSVRYEITVTPAISAAVEKHCADTGQTRSGLIQELLVKRFKLPPEALKGGQPGPKKTAPATAPKQPRKKSG